MGLRVFVRPLCSIGREPGTDPAFACPELKSTREYHAFRWETDIPLAVANLALARETAGRALLNRAALDILSKTSTKDIPPLAKRQILRDRGLFVCIIGNESPTRWDLTGTARAMLADAPRTPSLTLERIQVILTLHDMAV